MRLFVGICLVMAAPALAILVGTVSMYLAWAFCFPIGLLCGLLAAQLLSDEFRYR